MARRFGVLIVILLVVGLFVWAGVHNLRERRAAMQQAQQKQSVLVKESGGGTDQDVPEGLGTNMRNKRAPAFTLSTVDGKKVSLADYKGKPVIVNFWGTYCGPCKLEMPWFEEFSKKYASQQLVVLGLDDEDGVTKADVEKAAHKIGVTYPILIADDKTSKDYGLGDYLPETFYVDKDGVIVDQTTGSPSKDAMEASIHKILTPSAM